MKNFFIVTNAFKDENFKLSNSISDYLMERGAKCSISNIKESPDCSIDITADDVPEGTDYIVVLGGDGTMIRTAGALAVLGLPIVGVNLGHVGYLCELDTVNVYKALDRILAGDYIVEDRMMLHGKSSKCENMRYAINDFAISRQNSISMIQLKVKINGELLTIYHCDGVVISTPTGSTGYNLSANGPIVEPTAELLLLNPLNEHSLNSRCLVLNKDTEIELELVQRRKDRPERATVACDGTEKGILDVGDKILIRKSGTYVRILKLSNATFLDNLRKKMES